MLETLKNAGIHGMRAARGLLIAGGSSKRPVEVSGDPRCKHEWERTLEEVTRDNCEADFPVKLKYHRVKCNLCPRIELEAIISSQKRIAQ